MQAHRGLFVAWLLALACSSTATLSLPVAFRRMIDQGFASGANIDRAFVLLFVVALALALATAARFYFVSLLGERVVADLRGQLYAHLLGLDAGFFDRNRSGELVSRLTADAELLRSVVGSSMSVALRSTITVIGSIAMLFVTSPHLASYALVGIPLAVLPIVIGGRRLQKMSRASQDRVADANTLATETLGAVRTVQAHAREPYERGRFGSALATAVETARSRIRAQAMVTAVAIVLIFGAITLVLWSGAHDVVAGRMSAGTLGQFVLYALIGGGSVGALAEVWNELQRAAGGMGRITELLQEAPGIAAPAHPQPLPQPVRGEIALRRRDLPLPAAPGPARARRISTCACARAKPSPWSARPAPARAPCSRCCCASTIPTAGAIAVDGIDLRTLDPADAARRDRAGAAVADDLRHQRRATTSATAGSMPTDAEMRRRRRVRRGRRLPRRPARRLRQRTGRTRRAPVRRPAAAHRHRPRPAQGRADPAARRSHLRARRAERTRRAARAGEPDGRPHHAGDRASPRHRAQGRPHRGHGPRPHRRRRHARRS